MKYKAIIFDLFGTLVENLPESEYRITLAEIAALVSAEEGHFVSLWNAHFDELMTGKREVLECLGFVFEQMGLSLRDGELAAAYKLITDRVKQKLLPPTDALALLSYLNDRNYRIGLISNCSDEVPVLWKDTLLAPKVEKPVFSCSVRLKKPDPLIYLLATSRLGVKPSECVFVDDNLEPLEGATRLGMTAILIQDSRLNKFLIDSNGWSGPVISKIGELATILDRP